MPQCAGPRLGAEKNHPDEIAVEHNLPWQGFLVLNDLGQDDAAVCHHRQHVGEIIEINRNKRRVTRNDQV
jgi:hypothetical protein